MCNGDGFLICVVKRGVSRYLKDKCVHAASGGGSEMKQNRRFSVPYPKLNDRIAIQPVTEMLSAPAHGFGFLGLIFCIGLLGFST